MADTVRVRFLKTCETREATPQHFEEGKEYDLAPSSAERWLKRNAAEVVEEKPKAKKAEK